ncbi:MAG: ATP-binding cassette domain-containing protein [Clostridia bacterium]|nr:ATP-binding cassette domain-containing protein [Clostridia bacterium]
MSESLDKLNKDVCTNEQADENYLIEVRNLKEYFDVNTGFFTTTKLKAVDDISFRIKEGETLGLVGESGCGKTTAGRTLLHLYKPTSGEILYRGKPIKSKKEIREFRTNATMVFQDPYSSLNPRMTVADIIGEPLDVHKIYATKKERNDRIAELMGFVGLSSEHASRYAHEFSGGQRQRIGIARALAVNPEFIVCDEPVSALDVSIQAQVINMFDDLQKRLNLTYLFIAHDLLVVRYISDNIAVMYLGKIVEIGTADEVCDNPLHPYSRSLLSAVPAPDPKTARSNKRIVLEGDIPSPLKAPSGCTFRTRCRYATDICAQSCPSLELQPNGSYVACHNLEEVLRDSSDVNSAAYHEYSNAKNGYGDAKNALDEELDKLKKSQNNNAEV